MERAAGLKDHQAVRGRREAGGGRREAVGGRLKAEGSRLKAVGSEEKNGKRKMGVTYRLVPPSAGLRLARFTFHFSHFLKRRAR